MALTPLPPAREVVRPRVSPTTYPFPVAAAETVTVLSLPFAIVTDAVAPVPLPDSGIRVTLV